MVIRSSTSFIHLVMLYHVLWFKFNYNSDAKAVFEKQMLQRYFDPTTAGKIWTLKSSSISSHSKYIAYVQLLLLHSPKSSHSDPK